MNAKFTILSQSTKMILESFLKAIIFGCSLLQ